MLKRTHLALGVVVALYFLPHVENKILFSAIVLGASLLPDIETGFAKTRRRGLFRSRETISDRNGLLHTLTFCITISIAITFFFPVYALPFFIGYSFHLSLDAFSQQGIMPFWPWRKRARGHISPGGQIDRTLFYLFVVFGAALLIKLLFYNFTGQ